MAKRTNVPTFVVVPILLNVLISNLQVMERGRWSMKLNAYLTRVIVGSWLKCSIWRLIRLKTRQNKTKNAIGHGPSMFGTVNCATWQRCFLGMNGGQSPSNEPKRLHLPNAIDIASACCNEVMRYMCLCVRVFRETLRSLQFIGKSHFGLAETPTLQQKSFRIFVPIEPNLAHPNLLNLI